VRRAFISLIAKEINWWFRAKAAVGFDHLAAIVAFARIKFSEVDADIVRKTLEPTTREGRRRWRADAPKRKPGRPGGVTELLLQSYRRRPSGEGSADTSTDPG
jgi:hypothetical protein